MGVNLPEPRRSADKRQPEIRRDPREARLWPFGLALLAGCTAALVGLVGLAWLALALLHYPRVSHPGAISVHDTVGVFQLVFASVAGAGALVALIVAYRRQKVAESAAALDRASAQLERTRVYNERFTAAAAQIGDERPAIRLAGVHAMAGLADDWPENRQTCVDVLCAYLRMPYAREPAGGPALEDGNWLEWRAFQEVRHTVIRVIAAHLRQGAAVPWQSMDFDFTGVGFDGDVSFHGAKFSGKIVTFEGAKFSGESVSFLGAEFSGETVSFLGAAFSGKSVSFEGAKFSGERVSFGDAKLSGKRVSFESAKFSGEIAYFGRAEFSGESVSFLGAEFSGETVSFLGAEFSGKSVDFRIAKFSGERVSFESAEFSGESVNFFGAKFSGKSVSFESAKFSGKSVSFESAEFFGESVDFRIAKFSGESVTFGDALFSSKMVSFGGAEFSGGDVSFGGAEFSGESVSVTGAKFSGSNVSFGGAKFSGGQVDFSQVADWTHPPKFGRDGTPPPGVKLPAQPGASPDDGTSGGADSPLPTGS